jgi:hypothetical protein
MWLDSKTTSLQFGENWNSEWHSQRLQARVDQEQKNSKSINPFHAKSEIRP